MLKTMQCATCLNEGKRRNPYVALQAQNHKELT